MKIAPHISLSKMVADISSSAMVASLSFHGARTTNVILFHMYFYCSTVLALISMAIHSISLLSHLFDRSIESISENFLIKFAKNCTRTIGQWFQSFIMTYICMDCILKILPFSIMTKTTKDFALVTFACYISLLSLSLFAILFLFVFKNFACPDEATTKNPIRNTFIIILNLTLMDAKLSLLPKLRFAVR
ncbi:hypothetical protein [Candidatus Similichlamydia epinepheli]|uniref:hypothetical protein n=1 Tax=Candidatus Similichlamydia epinepheli TaxID=1903953 RepID=UPI0013008175|nr:hypothetical protein [Candidatus Similichlamydia epinepheli]